jgi:hypothetical protein
VSNAFINSFCVSVFTDWCSSTITREGYKIQETNADNGLDLEALKRNEYSIMSKISGMSSVKGESGDPETYNDAITRDVDRAKTLAISDALLKDDKADGILLPNVKYTTTVETTVSWFIFTFFKYSWVIDVEVVGRAMRVKTDEELGK